MIGNVGGVAILATSPPADPRLFVIEQTGVVHIFKDEVLQPTPFIDRTGPVTGGNGNGDETGMLGLAFHPHYASNGQFFLFYYTTQGGQRNVVERCTVMAGDPDRGDPASCVDVISVPDFAGNHNGGMIEFGSDGFLYIGTGDGGNANDPQRTGQDLNNLLGKILRVDVDNKASGKEYGIPSTNPYASGGGAPEVFISGLRNPWRWSFDRGTGDMWIGDVGQNALEEMTVLKAGEQAGKNLGWSRYEGRACFGNYPCAVSDTDVMPQDQRTHASGWASIITGQTYRGTCFPGLVGYHHYTDYEARELIRSRLMANGTLEITDLGVLVPGQPSSLHADARGEQYLTNTAGGVYRLEAGP
jgi:glucose/arabinose dehydrogenase